MFLDVAILFLSFSRFSTRHANSLLLYNGRFNGEHDFIALEIIDGQVRFSFSLGTEVSRVTAQVPGGVNDGMWHEVTVDYLNRVSNKILVILVVLVYDYRVIHPNFFVRNFMHVSG